MFREPATRAPYNVFKHEEPATRAPYVFKHDETATRAPYVFKHEEPRNSLNFQDPSDHWRK